MNADYKEIGRRIALRRKSLGLTQSQVEEMAGLSYKYLSNIERGISIPSIEVVIRLAAALNVTPDDFLLGAIQPDAQERWRSVAQRLRGLNPKQLELVSDFIELVIRHDM